MFQQEVRDNFGGHNLNLRVEMHLDSVSLLHVHVIMFWSQLLFKAAEWKSLPLMAASLAEGMKT